MRAVIRIVVLILCMGLVSITLPKTYTMSAIKGWVPGAKTKTYRVTQKLETREGTDAVYWLSWTADDIRSRGNHRTNTTATRWMGTKIGDPIEVITVGSDPEPYLRNDIFVEPGNFAFDFALLVMEATGIFLVMRAFLRDRKLRTLSSR